MCRTIKPIDLLTGTNKVWWPKTFSKMPCNNSIFIWFRFFKHLIRSHVFVKKDLTRNTFFKNSWSFSRVTPQKICRYFVPKFQLSAPQIVWLFPYLVYVVIFNIAVTCGYKENLKETKIEWLYMSLMKVKEKGKFMSLSMYRSKATIVSSKLYRINSKANEKLCISVFTP